MARSGALVLVLLLACKSKPTPNTHTIVGESTVLPHAPASPPSQLTSTMREVSAAGKTRRYLELAPPPTSEKLPLILVMHGDGGEPTGLHQGWPFEKATGNAAILAYPEGARRTWDLETTKDNPDVRYLEAIIDDVAARYPVDRTRIFAAGYSSGGFMANVLACHRPGLLRAISSSAGGAPYNQLEKWGNGFPKCPGQQPTAMIALHGEQDHSVTLDSGRFSAEYWAYVNGCQTLEMETTGYAECRAYRGCQAGKAVAWCTIGPLGHWVWTESAAASWVFFQSQSH